MPVHMPCTCLFHAHPCTSIHPHNTCLCTCLAPHALPYMPLPCPLLPCAAASTGAQATSGDLLLAHRGPGCLVGEMAMFSKTGQRTASVRCTTAVTARVIFKASAMGTRKLSARACVTWSLHLRIPAGLRPWGQAAPRCLSAGAFQPLFLSSCGSLLCRCFPCFTPPPVLVAPLTPSV